ncbi:MAG: CHAT domain-containing tetratricopeptide repeat protein [Bacteroidota bacterium]
MRQFIFRIIVFTFFLFPLLASGQNNIDSTANKKADELYQKAQEFIVDRNADSICFYFEQSIATYAEAGNWQQMFSKEISYSNILGRLGRNQHIIDRMSQKLKLSDSLNLDTLRLSNLLRERIAIAYNRIGRHTVACDYLQSFLKYSKKGVTRDSAYRDYIGKTYQNLAVSLMQSSRYELADIYYDSAIIELDKRGLRNTEMEQVIYLNKGNVNRRLGYYREAERYYLKSLSMMDVKGIDHIDKGLTFWYYANFFLDKNESEEDLRKAIQYNDSSWYYLKNTPSLSIYCLYQRGRAYGESGNFEAGLADLNEAVNIILKRYDENYFELGDTYTMIADIYLKMDSSQLAIDYLQKAIRIFDNSYQDNPENKALALITVGNCYFQLNDKERALQYYQRSMALINPGFEPDNFADNPNPNSLVKSVANFEALKRKTFVLKALFQDSRDFEYLESELSCYELMIGTINLGKKDLVELESKMSYNEKGYDVYKSAVLCAMHAYKLSGKKQYLEIAFKYCYRSKSSELIDRVIHANHRNNENKSHNKLLLRISDLKTAIGNLKKEIAFASDSVLKEKLTQDLFNNNEKLRALSDSANAINSKTGRITKGSIDLETFKQQLLKQNCLLLEFMEFDDQLVIFSLSKDLNAIMIPYSKTFKDSLAQYKVSIENRQFDPHLSHKIYNQLIEPILAKSPEKFNSLLIIPDGLATLIAFESLVTDTPQVGKPAKYLVEDFDITYNYSSLLNNLPRVSAEFDYDFLGFSPDYGKFSSKALATRGMQPGRQLPPLPSAQKEVAAIASLFKGKHLNGTNASEENFKNMAQNSMYLHLAAHAFSNDTDPLLSRVVLDNSIGVDDGDLFAYEIYNMNLNSDLVVLSACNTGTGKYQKGAGVISLASSFKYAGSQNLITSLWSVPDQPTAVIMNSFYRYINEGKTKADALRSAKLDYLKNADATTSLPYYWSGFILIGELEETTSNVFLWWLIAGIAFVALLVFIKMRK